ncbi:hypothetical protein KM043_018387 [Ampulex compressa]|nr:hypothetical protein KM043_018387 [Ampulex compressa]
MAPGYKALQSQLSTWQQRGLDCVSKVLAAIPQLPTRFSICSTSYLANKRWNRQELIGAVAKVAACYCAIRVIPSDKLHPVEQTQGLGGRGVCSRERIEEVRDPHRSRASMLTRLRFGATLSVLVNWTRRAKGGNRAFCQAKHCLFAGLAV